MDKFAQNFRVLDENYLRSDFSTICMCLPADDSADVGCGYRWGVRALDAALQTARSLLPSQAQRSGAFLSHVFEHSILLLLKLVHGMSHYAQSTTPSFANKCCREAFFCLS